MPKAKIKNDTWFKKEPVQSSKLGKNERLYVSAHQELAIVGSAQAEGGHVKITLASPYSDKCDRVEWYIWPDDVVVIEDDHGAAPEVEVITNLERNRDDLGPQVYIAGLGMMHLYEAISPNAPSFFVYELTKNGTRLGHTDSVGPGMVRIAEALQPYRDRRGEPFKITSGYRDPASNAAAGGVPNSQHLSGNALDGYFDSMNKFEMWDFFDPTWAGGLGIYGHNNIIHLDARGYYARWGK